jgi:hypothetical protein
MLDWLRAASADGEVEDRVEQSILYIQGIRMASLLCVSVHGASDARVLQTIYYRSHRHEDEVCLFWVAGIVRHHSEAWPCRRWRQRCLLLC